MKFQVKENLKDSLVTSLVSKEDNFSVDIMCRINSEETFFDMSVVSNIGYEAVEGKFKTLNEAIEYAETNYEILLDMKNKADILLECVFEPDEVFLETVFNNGINIYCNTSKKQYLEDGYIILPEKEAMQKINENIEKRYFSNIKIVDEERYWDMLEVLPPLKRFNCGFTMSERQIEDVTKAFICIEDLYFELCVRTSWDESEIIDQATRLLLKQYKEVCNDKSYDYEFNNIDEVKNNCGAYKHLTDIICA